MQCKVCGIPIGENGPSNLISVGVAKEKYDPEYGGYHQQSCVSLCESDWAYYKSVMNLHTEWVNKFLGLEGEECLLKL